MKESCALTVYLIGGLKFSFIRAIWGLVFGSIWVYLLYMGAHKMGGVGYRDRSGEMFT